MSPACNSQEGKGGLPVNLRLDITCLFYISNHHRGNSYYHSIPECVRKIGSLLGPSYFFRMNKVLKNTLPRRPCWVDLP